MHIAEKKKSSSMALKNADGRDMGNVGSCRDITERECRCI